MGFIKNLGQTALSRLNPKTIVSEVLETVIGRMSHGASEVAQGLFTQGAAYVPYGQDAMPIAAPDAAATEAPASAEPEAPAAMPSPDEQYQTQVAMHAMRGQSPTHQGPSL